MTPRVSVVIATFNRARWLPFTLDSVLAQTADDLEIIVVDDGSTDDTAQVVQGYGDRVRYVYQPNAERGAARNHGLRLAVGEFISFLDSDDLWTPGKLQAELDCFDRSPGLGLVYSQAAYIDEAGRFLGNGRAYRYEGDILEDIVRRNVVAFSAHLVRRSLVMECGGFREERELSGSEDWELWTRIAARAPFGCVSTVGLLYRVHSGATVSSPESMERSMRRACEVIYANPELAPRISSSYGETRAYIDLVAGSLYYAAGRPRQAWRCLLRACLHSAAAATDQHSWGLAARLIAGRRLAQAVRRISRAPLQNGT